MKIKIQKIGKKYIHLGIESNTNDNIFSEISFEHISGKIFYLKKDNGDCHIDSVAIDLGTNDSEFMYRSCSKDKRDIQYYCFTELMKQFREINSQPKEDDPTFFEIEI